MITTVALIWFWITVVILAVGAILLLGNLIARLVLAFIMTKQWRREAEEYDADDDYPRDIR